MRSEIERKNVPFEGVSGHALSYDSEDHSKLVCDETLAPQIVPGVEHIAMLESGEANAVQIETPDDHLGCLVESGG